MFILGHVGITTGLVYAVNKRYFRNKIDFRQIAFLSLGPDIADKPVALLFKENYGFNSRLFGHTLLLSLFLFFYIYFIFRRKKNFAWSHCILIWSAFFGHNILDQFWSKSLRMFFWPFMGYPAPLESDILMRWWENLLQPATFVPEIIGFAILLYLGLRLRLESPRKFRQFPYTGELL